MTDIYRFRCIASKGAGYTAVINYKNPNSDKWKPTDRVTGPVTVGITKDVYLKDVKEIEDGASVQIAMAYGPSRTAAKEVFTYKRDSVNYAKYDGYTAVKGKNIKLLEVVCELQDKGEASGFYFASNAWYAFDAKIEYQNPGKGKAVTKHVVRVNKGIPKTIQIGDFPEILDGAKVRFIMDIVSGRQDVHADQVFTYKADITCIAQYECSGTTCNETIKYLGKSDSKPALFAGEKGRNSSIHSTGSQGLTRNTYVRVPNNKLSDVIRFADNGYVASIEMEKSSNKISTFASGPEGIKHRGHIWFMDEKYDCREEDVMFHGIRPRENLTEVKTPNVKYISWNDKPLGGDFNPVLRLATIAGKFENIFRRFDFIRREWNGRYFYTTDVECWQKKWGYSDLYDYFFDYATNMERKKFEFTSNGKKYMFWLWKGNYLNLGAGAELGFYEYYGDVSCKVAEGYLREIVTGTVLSMFAALIPEPASLAVITGILNSILTEVFSKHNEKTYKHYIGVPKEQYLKMELNLQGKNNLPATIYNYTPAPKQWWITTFAPYLQGVQPKDLAPKFTITFTKEQEQLFNDFVESQIKACGNDVEVIESETIDARSGLIDRMRDQLHSDILDSAIKGLTEDRYNVEWVVGARSSIEDLAGVIPGAIVVGSGSRFVRTNVIKGRVNGWLFDRKNLTLEYVF